MQPDRVILHQNIRNDIPDIMKQILPLIALSCAMTAGAQTESTDSIPAQELKEIVIEAPKVIRKADMDVYHPSKSAVEASQNGLQLLNNLMIPTLSVSDALETIQAAGQSVQVRINGRESSITQVKALLPESIKRVEWIDNPGLRYGGANYVLNFIVSNPTTGGSLMAMARPALNQAWGVYFADAKFNKRLTMGSRRAIQANQQNRHSSRLYGNIHHSRRHVDHPRRDIARRNNGQLFRQCMGIV